jgi:hypothetical protein
MALAADKAVVVLGDEPGGEWTELHVCFECFTTKLIALAGAIESDSKPGGEGR